MIQCHKNNLWLLLNQFNGKTVTIKLIKEEQGEEEDTNKTIEEWEEVAITTLEVVTEVEAAWECGVVDMSREAHTIMVEEVPIKIILTTEIKVMDKLDQEEISKL